MGKLSEAWLVVKRLTESFDKKLLVFAPSGNKTGYLQEIFILVSRFLINIRISGIRRFAIRHTLGQIRGKRAFENLYKLQSFGASSIVNQGPVAISEALE